MSGAESLTSLEGDSCRSGDGASDVSDRLFDAAIRILNREGLADLTIRRVAAEANLGVATAYVHLGSKNELLAEIGRRALFERSSAVPAVLWSTTVGDAAGSFSNHAVPVYATPESPFNVEKVEADIARDARQRVQLAIGPDASPGRRKALEALYVHVVLNASVGYSLQTGAGTVEHVAARIMHRSDSAADVSALGVLDRGA